MPDNELIKKEQSVSKYEGKKIGIETALKSKGFLNAFNVLLTSYEYKSVEIRKNIDIHSVYTAAPRGIEEITDYYKLIRFWMFCLKDIYPDNSPIIMFLGSNRFFLKKSKDNKNWDRFFISGLMTDIIFNSPTSILNNLNDGNELLVLIDSELKIILNNNEFKNNNNKNTALDKNDTTSNDLDTLKEQKDGPQPDSRLRRDFKSAQWSKKPKLKAKTPAKDEQERFALRTFPQVYRIIDKAIQESGEGKTEWIVRAIIDRLMIDHPHLFEELKSQKDEFPEVRSDAKTGIDFMYE